MACKCQECRKMFKIDLLIPDKLRPIVKASGSGLLCGSCIMKKLERLDKYQAWELRQPQAKQVFVYHGTNKQNALSIIKTGFAPGTYFSRHLEDSLAFGGSWVFMVEWVDPPDNWQFLNKKRIPPERINRLTQYRPIVRISSSLKRPKNKYFYLYQNAKSLWVSMYKKYW